MTSLRTILFPALLAIVSTAVAQPLRQLETEFATPPASAKPFVWWHWMNGNVSRSGITKDLEAIKAAGIGGVTLFEEGDRIPAGSVRYGSPEHFALISFAAAECTRLGLHFGFANAPGWSSSGGPWITPEYAMKHLTWSESGVAGGRHVKLQLPPPPTTVRPYGALPPGDRYEPSHHYYRDVAVLAFPTPAAPDWRLENWEEKADFRTALHLREQTKDAPRGAVIPKKAIVFLTGRMGADGTLDWDAPPGQWTVLRVGYTLTEHANREAPTTGARGLECDKFSPQAVDFHWNAFDQKVLAAIARVPGAHADGLTIDSYETLSQTWTPNMPADFAQLRGYDLLPYLLCLTGRAVDSVRESERFLWDYRRTLADLMAKNYYGRFAEKCRERGLTFSAEAYGFFGTFMDDFQSGEQLDIPMGEFWAGVVKWHHWSGKTAASAADITGRHVVGAEAFTAGNAEAAWMWSPATLKAQGDYFFCRGINRFYIQACAHQPWDDDIRPGMTFGPHGMQMNRKNTWFAQSRGWVDYLTRCQYLLQHGQLVTDVFYDYGNNAPSSLRPNHHVTDAGPKGLKWDPDADLSPDTPQPLPSGRDFHVGNDTVVLNMHVNDRGQLQLANGQRYELLLLPNDSRMPLANLRKIAELVHEGATVVGPKPLTSPTLEDRNSDAAIGSLAAELWGDIDGKRVTSHRYGKGTVWFGAPLEEILEQKGLPRDFEYRAAATLAGPPPRIDYMHRRAEDGEFYFVSNQRNLPASVDCVFRAGGPAPELWLPETGQTRPAPLWHREADGRTTVTLNLAPAESLFVVFRDDDTKSAPPALGFTRDNAAIATALEASLRWSDGQPLVTAFTPGSYSVQTATGRRYSGTVSDITMPIDLSSDWDLSFPAGLGAPSQAHLPRLQSLAENANSGIKYFSGTVTYTRHFDVPAEGLANARIAELDLGDVQVLAELSVNGRDFGLLWKPPYRCDITSALHPGTNTVAVKVTDLWRNRLIGDARLRGFTAADAARDLDQILAGKPMVSTPSSAKATPAEKDLPVPAWVRQGGHDPDPRVVTFTTSRFLNADTPLVASGLIGPVRIEFGETAALK